MLQLSFRVFGLLADAAYFITWSSMYLGVTSSDNLSKRSKTFYVILTSPILSESKGMMHDTVLLLTFSQEEAMTEKSAMVSLIRLRLLSFQSFIFIFTNFATASMTS